MTPSNEFHAAVKDESRAHPVASAWRPTLREIVAALAHGDALRLKVAAVAPLSPENVEEIAASISAYGETLAELPEDAWKTSVAQWMGTHWEVLVDLWTVESGASDLVLNARVYEADGGFLFEIDSVHVP